MSAKSVNWTKEQSQVIESRGCNLLVSAAAGSGKTAVLVERIIRMVTEGDHPLDIDRLLVMTFTNAAAAEMRERIGAAIEQKLDEQPDNEHLQIQAALVHYARITTIDSFCLDLIRNHFNLLDLDPSFQIGDEGELTLLRGDVMEEMLEDYYAKGDPRFERFVETFAQGKGDFGIEDRILQVYTFSQSHPYPEQWIGRCREELGKGGAAGPDGEEPRRGGITELDGNGEGLDEGVAGLDSDGDGLDDELPWMRFLIDDLKKQLTELTQQLAEALQLCLADEILRAYAPMLEEDIRQLAEAAEAEEFSDLYECLQNVQWARLATVRNKEVDPEKKARVTGCRDRVKKAVGRMKELYCFTTPEKMAEDLAASGEPVEMLLELAEEFSRRYQEKKRERNLVDFNDLEHEALKVLIREEDGEMVYTDAADQLSLQFEEVLVDEYQDSNLVQEALLMAVSQERFGHPNVFMVGDVKQSIYKFRLARPELFLWKYHSYEPYEGAAGTNRKIELHQNFRSRSQVLEGVNDVFYRIMTENLGNIRYTEETALHPGARFADYEAGETRAEGTETEEGIGTTEYKETKGGKETCGLPELLVMDTGKEAMAGLEEDVADATARELEARLIGARIRELTDPDHGLLVWDKKLNGTGGYRTASYRDIVILLRSTAGWTETFLPVLANMGIPAYAESRMGYFNTVEVETVLGMLAVIDNPMQDIPLTAVLHSPMGGLTDEELARMTAAYRGLAVRGQDRGLYGAVRYVLEYEAAAVVGASQADLNLGPIREKLLRFWKMLERFRQESTYLPIHELIYHVYQATGYYDYVSAMPAGETRRANLDMLVEKAAAYEKTSYKGLFHFIRYVENLKKYNTDFGEASTVSEEDDTVRIMSIHKSKGLEFPVVFLAGMGKKFNRQDVYGRILIDPELGIATDYLDLENRLKAPTLKKHVLRRKMELDSLGEELRILYVAMTRAKEKLIMTGTDRYLGKTLEKTAHIPLVNGQIPYTILSTAGSCLDWLLMAMGGEDGPVRIDGEGGLVRIDGENGPVRIELKGIPVGELVGEEAERQLQSRYSKEWLLSLDPQKEYQKEYREMLLANLDYRYPHEADTRLYAEMSVSELKKRGQRLGQEENLVYTRLPEEEPEPASGGHAQTAPVAGGLAPASRSPVLSSLAPADDLPPDGGQGAARGTAYHRAMELLPFDRLTDDGEVDACLRELVEKGMFAREDYERIDSAVIGAFLRSELGRRMSRAQREGRLRREQQFVIGIPAREMGIADSEELVIIQGIIDAYLEEDGELVVIDYKTDKVRSARVLADHYRVQLDYYKRALEQMTGKRVKEKILYSLTLQQAIPV